MQRTLFIIFFLTSCATCFGQTSYNGLTPGQSTRAEVERALGEPTNKLTDRLLEYEEGGKQETSTSYVTDSGDNYIDLFNHCGTATSFTLTVSIY